MKKFLTVSSVLLLVGLFSAGALAAEYPSVPDPFGTEDAAPPSLESNTESTSSSSSSGSYVRQPTTASTPAPTTIRTTPPPPTLAMETEVPTEERSIPKTGPEMIYLLLLGLLLIGGYRFAMKKK